MIELGIGWLIGFLNALVLFYLAQKPAVSRTIAQTKSALKPKGSIIEPENTELSQWLNELHEETPRV